MLIDFNLADEPKSLFSSFEEATSYLDSVCARMKVNHLSYWLVSTVDGTPDQVSWIATYDPSYMSYYMANYTPLGDPMFESSIAENSIIDWNQWLPTDPVSQTMEITAAKYGITKYGISIPLLDGDFGNVLFSVNVQSSDAEWGTLRSTLVARMRPFALYFHQRAKPLIESRKIKDMTFAA